jgi:hypothetical protein
MDGLAITPMMDRLSVLRHPTIDVFSRSDITGLRVMARE